MGEFVMFKDVMRCLYSTRESESIKKRLEEIPRYDVKPVVRSKWWVYEGLISCMECSEEVEEMTPFCPYCGADMRKEEK